jgi:hypothetical protein
VSHRTISRCVLAGTFVLTCTLLCGCASEKNTPAPAAAAPPPQPPTPATLTQIKQELVAAKAQLDTTTAAMNTLAKSGNADVQSNYDKFCTEYAKLKSDADTCRSRSDDLKARTKAYFDQWNKQAEVQNPDLRRSATEQRADAEKTFSTIKSEIELARLSFDPYMSQLKDISTYLKDNKTPAALETVNDISTKATANAGEVNKHLDAVLGGINQIMSASGEGTAVPAAVPASPTK